METPLIIDQELGFTSLPVIIADEILSRRVVLVTKQLRLDQHILVSHSCILSIE